MRILIFGLMALMMQLKLSAALPPLYQSMNEFKALLTNQQLIDQLDAAEALVEIKKEKGGFQIVTSKKTLWAELIYDPIEMAGPAKFHFEIRVQSQPKS
jgi:hypothetical protein